MENQTFYLHVLWSTHQVLTSLLCSLIPYFVFISMPRLYTVFSIIHVQYATISTPFPSLFIPYSALLLPTLLYIIYSPQLTLHHLLLPISPFSFLFPCSILFCTRQSPYLTVHSLHSLLIPSAFHTPHTLCPLTFIPHTPFPGFSSLLRPLPLYSSLHSVHSPCLTLLLSQAHLPFS